MATFARIAVAGAIAAAIFGTKPAAAQTVECVNCSTIYDQVVELGKQAQQYATQLSQYGTELREYANMVQNTVALPVMLWSQAQSDILQVQSIMNAVGMLGGNAGSFTQQLGQIGSFTNQITSLAAMQSQYQIWATVTQKDTAALQAALGLQETQRINDTVLLSGIDLHSQTAMGQMQAIQAGNEFASLGVKQMQSMQQILAAQARVVQDQATVAADRQAAEDQAVSQFLSNPDLPTSGGQGY
jgi:P-type conjugative transfer protein TrbJ